MRNFSTPVYSIRSPQSGNVKTKTATEAFTEALPPADTDDQAAGGPHFADRAEDQKRT